MLLHSRYVPDARHIGYSAGEDNPKSTFATGVLIMPGTWKTIRVFISSTFRDMHAERDQLNRFVFPELRSRCQRRGVEFIGIDLRWGLTSEETQGAGALQVCLQEIERCRPYFVCLLGERFGWVPPPQEIAPTFYERIRNAPGLPPDQAQQLEEWYRCDEGSVPPVYRLRSDREVPPDVAGWLARFWERHGLPLAGQSITAREILRGVFERGYPPTRALFYLRQPGVTADPSFPASFVPVFTEVDPHNQTKLARLREQIQDRANEVLVRDYEGRYAGLRIDPSFLPAELSEAERESFKDGVIQAEELEGLSPQVRQIVDEYGTVGLEDMDTLGQLILDDLWKAIETELNEQEQRPEAELDQHQRERAWHRRFLEDRTRLVDPERDVRSFVGREDELARMLAYAQDSKDRLPLIVTGAPGSGKSALLAEFARRCEEQFSEALVLPHFIGAAPGSAELSHTLRSLCEELRRECRLEEEVPSDPQQLRSKFPVFLEQAGAVRRVVLVLDALNQLSAASRSDDFGWFPFRLPEGVRVVTSTLAGPYLDRLRKRTDDAHLLDVPVIPAADRATIVRQQLARRRKKLSDAQLARLLDTQQRRDAGLPLYLLVAVEELCLFGSYDDLDQRIARLPGTLAELFDQVLARLEGDHHWELVQPVCRWLAASRSGLLESEILDLLRSTDERFSRRRWAQLYRSLEFYLRPTSDVGSGDIALVDFYHDQLRFAVFTRYFSMATPGEERTDAYRSTHDDLARYYHAALNPPDAVPWSGVCPRGLTELPYHQTGGALWNDLVATLCDLRFIEAKCSAGMTYDLVGNYAACLNVMPELVQDLLRLERKVQEGHTYDHPNDISTTRQTIDNGETNAAIALEGGQGEVAAGTKLLRQLTAADQQGQNDSAASMELAGNSIRIFAKFLSSNANAFAAQPAAVLHRALNYADRGPVVESAWERLRSSTPVADPSEFRSVRPPLALSENLMRTLTGHQSPILSVHLMPGGRTAVSVDRSSRIRLWDVTTGECLGVHHVESGITSSSIIARGTLLAIGADANRIELRKLPDMQMDGTIATEDILPRILATDEIGGILVTGQANGTIDLCDTASRSSIRRLGPHPGLGCLAISGDGRSVISGDNDGVVRVWDIGNGDCVGEFVGHKRRIRCVWISECGQHAVTAADDWRICLWNLASQSHVRTLEGHSSGIVSLHGSPDGKVFLSCGRWDRHIIVWDAHQGTVRRAIATNDFITCSDWSSSQGHLVVTGHRSGLLRVWDILPQPDSTRQPSEREDIQ